MAADLLTRICAEIEERMAQLRPALEEYERLLGAAEAFDLEVGLTATAASAATTAPRRRAVRKPRAPRIGPSEEAIVAALEHGSHTLAELGMVTAMSGGQIRESAQRLLAAGRIVRAKRDGKAAYALADNAA